MEQSVPAERGGDEVYLEDFQPNEPLFKDDDCRLITVPAAVISFEQCDRLRYCLVVDNITCGFLSSRLVGLLGQALEAGTPMPSQLIIGKLNKSVHYRALSQHISSCDAQIDPRLFFLACSLELAAYPEEFVSGRKQRYGFPDIPNLGIFASLKDGGWFYDVIFPEKDFLSCLQDEWILWASPLQR